MFRNVVACYFQKQERIVYSERFNYSIKLRRLQFTMSI